MSVDGGAGLGDLVPGGIQRAARPAASLGIAVDSSGPGVVPARQSAGRGVRTEGGIVVAPAVVEADDLGRIDHPAAVPAATGVVDPGAAADDRETVLASG